MSAANTIRKYVIKWLARKRLGEKRLIKGCLISSEFVDVCDLRIGWFMHANIEQTKFTVTVKERFSQTMLIDREQLSNNVVIRAKAKSNCEYILQGASRILRKLILNECITLISHNGSSDIKAKAHNDWAKSLSQKLSEKMIK